MIKSKQHLRFYIMADRMMNIGSFKLSIINSIKYLLGMLPIISYLYELRNVEYYEYKINVTTPPLRYIYIVFRSLHKINLSRIGRKMGFTIYPNVLEYGVSIPHWGTIVIGPGNKIGKYSLFHTSTCIPKGNRSIGDFLYLSSGAKISGKDIILGNNITIASNSVCTKSISGDNLLVAGMPAIAKKTDQRWVDRDGKEFQQRVEQIESIKEKMGIK